MTAFPKFKSLELGDRPAIEAITDRYPPYSDTEFASLWAWDVREEIGWCVWGQSLVIRFTDYTSGRPFLTFLGDGGGGLANTLIDLSIAEGFGSSLMMVPEASIDGLEADGLIVEEARDHFDYVYDLERYLTFDGGRLKSRRNFLNGFLKRYPTYQARPLDLACGRTHTQIAGLREHWEANRDCAIPNESRAYERFLLAVDNFEHVATGIFVENELRAFNITALMPKAYGNGLFEKADTRLHGIYQALLHEVAKALLAEGCRHLNYEQDLGIESLRRAKLALDPAVLLRKFTVRRAGSAGSARALEGLQSSASDGSRR